MLEAAARYVDVASFNDYAIIPELEAPLRNADPTYLPVDHALAAQSHLVGKPIIVSEWSFRAHDCAYFQLAATVTTPPADPPGAPDDPPAAGVPVVADPNLTG